MTVVELARSARGPLAVLAGFGLVFVSLLVARAPLDAATVSLAVCGGTLVYALRRMFLLARALARPDSLAQVGRGAGSFTVAELRDEKRRLLRAIKELEFDRGMGKVSDKDFAEMSARLRARAARIMRQLDAGSLYREQIEKEVERRLAATTPRKPAPAVCAACSITNEPDARFCKNCGQRLGAP